MNSWKNSSNSSDYISAAIDFRQMQSRLACSPSVQAPYMERFFPAGVILLLYEKKRQPYVLTVLKTQTPGYPWSNQIALPGGHMDEKDDTLLETALRELSEELGITRDHLMIAGTMGSFFTIRQTVIECFVALWDGEKSRLRSDPREIARVLEIPVNALRRIHESAGFSGRIPDIDELRYPYDGLVIWGVTARMIHFLLEHVI